MSSQADQGVLFVSCEGTFGVNQFRSALFRTNLDLDYDAYFSGQNRIKNGKNKQKKEMFHLIIFFFFTCLKHLGQTVFLTMQYVSFILQTFK